MVLDPNTPLVTQDEVRAIYECDADKNLQPFIDTAHLIVCENLANSGASDARLKQIELYLSAHFACSSDGGQLQSEKIGDATDVYAHQTESGLMSTFFGQTAIALDPSGKLSEMGGLKKNARMVLTGRPTSPYRAPWPQT